jgi:hypothetical protein
MAQLGRSDRFYANPILRDQEWNRATQPSWLLTVAAMAIVGVAFFFGVYGSPSQSTIGWTVGVITILIYMGLGGIRRGWARRHLRKVHGQATR